VTGIGAQVDVVVVTWNTRDLTLSALQHLADSAPAGSVNLYVHDNGSTDGSADAIAAAWPSATIEACPTNLGFAAGVNQALRRTTSPWILLLNSDAWPEPGAIAQLVECAERNPRAAAVVPRLLRPDGGLEFSTWPFPSLRTAASSALRAGRYAWDHDVERQVDWAVGAVWLLRRAALEAIGGLDDSLFMYAEDLDWCWRAHDAGWQIWFTPTAVFRHVGNASGSHKFGAQRSAAWINNSIRVHHKHRSLPATISWQVVNAAGAGLSAWRARRRHNPELERIWRSQARQWLRRARDDRSQAAA
jgi:N-acetylglucosaminyl-diphospho-decaprenol L-rhamnosyltransferase